MLINQSWKFYLGDPDAQYYQKDFNDTKWKTVSIPHTLSLTSLNLDNCQDSKKQETFQRNVGWYRKSLKVSNNSGSLVVLEFEGAHQVTDLWVNGEHVGQHSIGGYSPFHFDITEYVVRGEDNKITLKVDNRKREDVPPDPGPFDYIKFSGLYRDVYLVEYDKLHINYNWEAIDAGVLITTPTVDPIRMNAVINIKTTVVNDYNEEKTVTLRSQVVDNSGKVVLNLRSVFPIKANGKHTFNQVGAIEDDLKLWSVDNPYLYKVLNTVMVNEKPIDIAINKLGIRKFEHDPEKGFFLNGKPILLIGANRHQHYPYIGDALPNSLHHKDMLQFKQLGYNCMRTAHYPHDDAVLNACDELGILVYEEAPTWVGMHDTKWFDNMENAARVMVRNHRNHPSVVIWGAGINHRGYVPQLVCAIKQEDPTRLTGSQSSRWTGWQASGLSDIFANMIYGPVVWDKKEVMLAMEGRRGYAEVAKYKRDSMLSGLISWTAHAYYTFHPSNDEDRVRGGMMTIFRQFRPGLEWSIPEFVDKPSIFIEEEWLPGNKRVTIHSNCEEVALMVNGTSVERKKKSWDSLTLGLSHPPFFFDVEYEKGKVEAIGYNNGAIVVRTEKRTPNAPYGINLIIDTEGRDVLADGNDIVIAYAHIVDENGTAITDAMIDVEFKIKGDASVVNDKGIGANPMISKYYGVAPVLIRSGYASGQVEITASAKGLKSAKGEYKTILPNLDALQNQAFEVFDPQTQKIDLGAPDQLVQFGWMPWNATDNDHATLKLEQWNGVMLELKHASDSGIMRWLGEMNVMGKYGFACGEGVLGIDKEGLVLIIRGLPKGKYALVSTHHAPRSNTDSMDPNREKLKKLKITKIPYAQKVKVLVRNGEKAEVAITDGKDVSDVGAATTKVLFYADGKNEVVINYKDPEGNKGVWLNALELSKSK
ncbi:DUF4982 domain-containing protein [Bacteroidales bacterium]|nr:DUF4982 domain-containing protein [Bacteroidales bacterium]